MSLFNFNMEELLTFFAVLVRYSVLFSVLPFVGDNHVPAPVKILLSLSASMALFPGLVASGVIHPSDASVWGASVQGIIFTIGAEVIFALILGYVARLAFETIHFGGNLVGNFMGFGIASTYDPNMQSQTQVVAEIQAAIGILVFLAVDGHHLMIRAALQSYQVVGLGGAGVAGGPSAYLNAGAVQRLGELTAQVLRLGIEISAPIAIVLFALNIVFGILAKAMPQLNILILSVTISALVGLIMMFLTISEFQAAAGEIFARMGTNMNAILQSLAHGH
ncbi:MAG: flagellar biosynthetic protein FliR [Oligoflexia bacterium]|nr:flagellar biosynthetic protein FliR [Oligoflexia bacterium]